MGRKCRSNRQLYESAIFQRIRCRRYFRSDQIAFRSDQIAFRSDQIAFRSDQIVFRPDQIPSRTVCLFLSTSFHRPSDDLIRSEHDRVWNSEAARTYKYPACSNTGDLATDCPCYRAESDFSAIELTCCPNSGAGTCQGSNPTSCGSNWHHACFGISSSGSGTVSTCSQCVGVSSCHTLLKDFTQISQGQDLTVRCSVDPSTCTGAAIWGCPELVTTGGNSVSGDLSGSSRICLLARMMGIPAFTDMKFHNQGTKTYNFESCAMNSIVSQSWSGSDLGFYYHTTAPPPTPYPTPNPTPNSTPYPTPDPTTYPTPNPTPSYPTFAYPTYYPTSSPSVSSPSESPTASLATPYPTPAPTNPPGDQPAVRYSVDITFPYLYMPLTTTQKDDLKTRLVAMLNLDSAKFQLSFRLGSVVMTVTFLDGSSPTRTPYDEALSLNSMSLPNLSNGLGQTVSTVSSPQTANAPTPSSSSDDGDSSGSGDSSNAGIIAGAVVGGLAGAAAIGLAWYFCKRDAKTHAIVINTSSGGL